MASITVLNVNFATFLALPMMVLLSARVMSYTIVYYIMEQKIYQEESRKNTLQICEDVI